VRDEIIKGLREGEFFVLYQPLMQADGSRMAGVEALLRWDNPTRGPVGPTTFIPVAEREGLIQELGLFVLRRAMRDGLNWPSLTISVNVSSLQLVEADFPDIVFREAEAAGFPLARLELEIVESAVIDNFERASAACMRLRERGVRIALDDFGTGYSSLTYLRRLPIDRLKIDKSFVDDAGLLQSAAIIQATVALARALGLKVTAEGVETQEQSRFLRISGSHELQGYLFSKPVSAEAISRLLADALPRRHAAG